MEETANIILGIIAQSLLLAGLAALIFLIVRDALKK